MNKRRRFKAKRRRANTRAYMEDFRWCMADPMGWLEARRRSGAIQRIRDVIDQAWDLEYQP